MPKVVIVHRISGSRDGQDWPAPGETIDVPGEEASDLVRLGFAEFVDVKAEKAVAVAPAVESATRKGGLTKANGV